MIDIAAPLRSFVIANAAVTNNLSVFNGEPAVFTRRPAPSGAVYPMLFISTSIGYAEQDYLANKHGVIARDMTVYGRNDTAENYRKVETCAFALVNLLHRAHPTNFALTGGWSVVQITAAGPAPAPTEDLDLIGRVIRLSIEVDQT